MEWRIIPGFGKYEVNADGGIRKGNVILKANITDSGYSRVTLTNGLVKKSFYVHRLVAMAFMYNQDTTLIVNHKNGNRSDNRLINLEWVTHSENSKHAYDNGRRPSTEKKIVAVDDNGNMIACFRGGAEAARMFNVCKSSIWNAVRTGHRCAGYRWILNANS